MRLDIDSQDISNAEPCRCCNCPIARRLKRMYPGCQVTVTLYWVHVYEGNHVKKCFTTGDTARAFIGFYDMHKYAYPTTIDLQEVDVVRQH